MRLARPAALLAAMLLWAPLAAAQSPTERRETLTALAGTLGQSHALRQACAGPADQYWRARMMRLMEVERPDSALGERLTEAFNSGYASRRSMFRACTPQARRAEAAAAAKGRALSVQLSRAVQPAPMESGEAGPDAVAPGARAQ